MVVPVGMVAGSRFRGAKGRGKLLRPLLLYPEGHGVGKILFKHLRRDPRRVKVLEAVLIRHLEVELEAFKLIEKLPPLCRGRLDAEIP